MKKSERQNYEHELEQLTLNRRIEKWSWLEHVRRAQELNQIMSGSGDKHLQEANEIAKKLRPIWDRMKELHELLWKKLQETLMGP